jgi:hypothetical protein
MGLSFALVLSSVLNVLQEAMNRLAMRLNPIIAMLRIFPGMVYVKDFIFTQEY